MTTFSAERSGSGRLSIAESVPGSGVIVTGSRSDSELLVGGEVITTIDGTPVRVSGPPA